MPLRTLLVVIILALGFALAGPTGTQGQPAAGDIIQTQVLPPLPGPASQILSQDGVPAGKQRLVEAPASWAMSPSAAQVMAGEDPPDPFALFEPYELHNPDIEARAVGAGDFNNDGLDDIVVTTGWPANQLLLYTQSLSGTLASTPLTYTTGLAPDTLAVGDLNNDGLDDVIVANQLEDTLSVFIQQTGSTLAHEVIYPTAPGPDAIAVEDLNQDNRQDVVVTHAGEPAIGVYLQNISGTLASPISYSAPLSAWNDVTTGDFNKDGLADVAKMNGQFSATPTLSLFTQNITGTLDTGGPLDLNEVVGNGVTASDLTGDGWDELVLSHGGNRPFAWLTQISTTVSATLAMTSTYPAYDVPETLLNVDANLDGREDILALHGGWSSLSISLQASTGGLLPYRLYDLPIPGATHYGPRALAAGDWNGDGLVDVAVADPVQGLVIFYHRKATALRFFPFASLPMRETETPVFDDFSDTESGWPHIISVYADFKYINDEYSITNHRPYVAGFATAGHRREDLDVAVDGRTYATSSPGGYGIAFGFTDSIPVTEYFALVVWPDYQEWNLIRFEWEYGFETLYWGASSNINLGELVNRMRVRRAGDELTIWINGLPLFGTKHPTYTGARLIGLLQAPLAVENDARYDNYVLMTP